MDANRRPRRRPQHRDMYIPELIEVRSEDCSTITGSGPYNAERTTTTICPITVRRRISDPYFKGNEEPKNVILKCLPKKIRKSISRMHRRRRKQFILAEDVYSGLEEMGWEVEEQHLVRNARVLVGGDCALEMAEDENGTNSSHTSVVTMPPGHIPVDPVLLQCTMVGIASIMGYVLYSHVTFTIS